MSSASTHFAKPTIDIGNTKYFSATGLTGAMQSTTAKDFLDLSCNPGLWAVRGNITLRGTTDVSYNYTTFGVAGCSSAGTLTQIIDGSENSNLTTYPSYTYIASGTTKVVSFSTFFQQNLGGAQTASLTFTPFFASGTLTLNAWSVELTRIA
jgi:D-alanyl-D-alanine carboxypeptidase